jgi:predicted RNA binding protein YcfA (HicA-like mRNA interferase family)
MGRLAGFRYRDITRRLKALGMEFHRQAAGSHEIWHHSATNRYTTIPNHPGDMPEGTLRAILKQGRHRARSVLAEEVTATSWPRVLMPFSCA